MRASRAYRSGQRHSSGARRLDGGVGLENLQILIDTFFEREPFRCNCQPLSGHRDGDFGICQGDVLLPAYGFTAC